MKALDTNVLVRFPVEDDAEMADTAAKLLETAEEEKEPLFVSLLVALELNWVLTSCYHFSRDQVLDVFTELLAMSALRFESADCLYKMMVIGHSSTLDLADILIGLRAKQEGCQTTATFDRKVLQSKLFCPA